MKIAWKVIHLSSNSAELSFGRSRRKRILFSQRHILALCTEQSECQCQSSTRLFKIILMLKISPSTAASDLSEL
jgi:hypothetical protein